MATRTSSRQLAAKNPGPTVSDKPAAVKAGVNKPRGMRGYAYVDENGNEVDFAIGQSTTSAAKSTKQKPDGEKEGWTTVGSRGRSAKSKTSSVQVERASSRPRTPAARLPSPPNPPAAPIMSQRLPSPATVSLLRPDSQPRLSASYAAVVASGHAQTATCAPEPIPSAINRDKNPGSAADTILQSVPAVQDLSAQTVSATQPSEPGPAVDANKKRLRDASTTRSSPPLDFAENSETAPPAKRRKTSETCPPPATQPASKTRIAPLTAQKRRALESAADARSSTELAERAAAAKAALQAPDWLSASGATKLGVALGASTTIDHIPAPGGDDELHRRIQARLVSMSTSSGELPLNTTRAGTLVSTPPPPPALPARSCSPSSGHHPSAVVSRASLPTGTPAASSTTLRAASPEKTSEAASSHVAPTAGMRVVSHVQSPSELPTRSPSPPASSIDPTHASLQLAALNSSSGPVDHAGVKVKKNRKASQKGKRAKKDSDEEEDDDDSEPVDTNAEKDHRQMKYFPMPTTGSDLQAMLTGKDDQPTRVGGNRGYLYPARKICFTRNNNKREYKHSLPRDYLSVTEPLEPSVVSQRRYQLWPAFAKGGQRLAEISRSLTIAIHLDLDRSKREVDVWANPWTLAHFGDELDDFVERLNGCASKIRTAIPTSTEAASVTTMLARDVQLQWEQFEASLKLAEAQNAKLVAELEGMRAAGTSGENREV